MFAFLTGAGLSAAAGLNAYIPLLIVGLISRFTDQLSLPVGFGWMSQWWVLAIVTVLLGVEFVVDKIPVVDHVNDVIQTVVRPVSGGAVAAASSAAGQWDDAVSSAVTTSVDPVPGAILGGLLALAVHAAKALLRPVINVGTAGLGGSTASVAEDTSSVGLSLLAIFLPILVGVALLVMLVVFVWLWRVLRRRRRARGARKAEAAASAG